MLTDDELSTLIAGRYADAGMTTSLDDVRQRARQRTRNGRIVLGAVAAIVVVAGASVAAFGGIELPYHTTSAGLPSDTTCAAQYRTMIAGRTDRAEIPAMLPRPVIDLHRGTAELRLYAMPAAGDRKQTVFDCALQDGHATDAHLTVATGVGTGAFGDVNDVDYYADNLPDGSSALVGDLPTGVRVVTVTRTDGTPLDLDSSGGFFVAWSSGGDAAIAEVVVTMNGDPVTLSQPTTLSGTFDPVSFGDACASQLATPGSTYRGSAEPVIKLVHDDDVYWIYSGGSTNAGAQLATCTFTSTATSHGLTLTSATEPAGTTLTYGIRSWITDTDGSGLVLGHVPDGTTAATVSRGGVVVTASVSDGAFAAWLPAGTGTETVTAVTPTGTHTYTHKG